MRDHGRRAGFGGETARAVAPRRAPGSGVDLGRAPQGELALQADVSDEEQVRGCTSPCASEFGRIDVLFNNAGITPTDDGSVLDTSLEAWQRVQDVNLPASSCAASTASRTCSTDPAAGR